MLSVCRLCSATAQPCWLTRSTTTLSTYSTAGTVRARPRLAVGTTNDQWVSTLYMEDADYFRIQNITLGYDFSKLWKSGPFSQLRLYVQAQNLHTFTKYSGVDPEIGSSGGKDSWARGIDVGLYPTARTYIVGSNS